MAKVYSINSINYKIGSTSIKFALQKLKPMNKQRHKPMTKKETEKVLQDFRQSILEQGYNGLKKEYIPVVEKYGTIEDKSALIINGRVDMLTDKKEPLLTKAQIMKIRQGICKLSEEDKGLYTHFIAMYYAYRGIEHLFYRAKATLEEVVNTVSLYYQTAEWLDKSEELLSEIEPLIAPEQKDKAKGLFDGFAEFMEEYKNFGYRYDVSKEERNIDFRQGAIDLANGAYVKSALTFKAILDQIKKFTEEYGGTYILPKGYRDAINWYDGGYFPVTYRQLFTNFNELDTTNKLYQETYKGTKELLHEEYQDYYE